MIINGYWGEHLPEERFTVNTCGHIFTFQGREINRPHGRDDYLLLYIYHGEAKFFFGGREELCHSGDFVLYAPHEPQHHIYTSNASGEFFYMHFSAKDRAILDLLGFESSMPYHSAASSELCDMFEEILSELQHKEDGYKEVCVALTRTLFVKIRRRVANRTDRRQPAEINAVIQRISRKYEENLTLEDYARLCGWSKYHFLKRFKEITHLPPLQYRNELRISHAKEMLVHSCTHINRIAEAVGFSSTEYFSESFKKATGMSPAQYRKTHFGPDRKMEENE